MGLSSPKILITAGPTREFLDPARFISNPSTGLMGYEIAKCALEAGMEVTLISGPVLLTVPKKINLVSIVTAQEMFEAVRKFFPSCSALVMTAAVSDYRPVSYSKGKLKKSRERLRVDFVRNPDILEWAGKNKKNQLLIGFAAETEDVIQNGIKKLKAKNLDLVIANKIGANDAGFESQSIRCAFLSRRKADSKLRIMKKSAAAKKIIKIVKDVFIG